MFDNESSYWVVTHIRKGAGDLARKMQRHGYYSASVYRKTNVIVCGENRPWAILSGYNTSDTQVVPVKSEDAAKQYVKDYA